MKQRVISAIVLLALVFSCVLLSPISRVLLVALAAVLGCVEMHRLKKGEGEDYPAYIAIAAALLIALLSILGAPAYLFTATFVAAVLVTLCVCVAAPKYAAKGAAAGLFSLCYPVLPFAVIMKIAAEDNWASIFCVAALATWFCDAFAMFGGMLFGKHKLIPAVSPKKTIEGTLCGALFSVLGGMLAWVILGDGAPNILLCMAVALVASSMGQFGDLAASLFKREAGIKDYSNLIPGHGGIMDRCDSLLFSIPTAWLCFKLAELFVK